MVHAIFDDLPPPLEMILWIAALPLLAFVAGAVLLRFGMRGRVLDDHPVCRRCGYDLHGLSDDQAVCPECGGDLRASGAVRSGQRRRRPGLVACGVLLTAGALAGFAVLGRNALHVLGEDANKPLWWLMRDFRSSGPARRNVILTELRKRMERGQLPSFSAREAVDRVLALQADHSIRWVRAWGNFIETARDKGFVDDTSWARYARQCLVLDLRVRKEVRRGDILPFSFLAGPSRLGSARFTLELKKVSVRVVGGGHVPIEWSGLYHLSWGSASGRKSEFTLPTEMLARLKDGMQRLEISYDCEIYSYSWRPHPTPPLLRFTASQTVPWTLLPSGVTGVLMVSDPAHQQEARQKLAIKHVQHRDDGTFLTTVATTGMSVDVAAKLIFRSESKHWDAGWVILRKGIPGSTFSSGAKRFTDFEANHIDVILRGSPEIAGRTLDMYQIWGGELTFKDVPVSARDQASSSSQSAPIYGR
ncbi:MAG TPA: zinc ribbon domain-containing protein [Tepidisphaeraceae bacterium]